MNFSELHERRRLLMATLRASMDELLSSRERLQRGSHGDGSTALGSAQRLQHAYGLTARESEVAALLKHGLSNVAVAQRLGISPHTARHHTQRVLVKLGVHSRAAAAARLRP
jgi:DNA-binding NarL/FixJ family response regulator